MGEPVEPLCVGLDRKSCAQCLRALSTEPGRLSPHACQSYHRNDRCGCLQLYVAEALGIQPETRLFKMKIQKEDSIFADCQSTRSVGIYDHPHKITARHL